MEEGYLFWQCLRPVDPVEASSPLEFGVVIPEGVGVWEGGVKSSSLVFQYYANLSVVFVGVLEDPFLDSLTVLVRTPK